MATLTARRIIAPPLHPGQRAVSRSRARFKVLACGRRWGKTRLGVSLCVGKAVNGGRAWWVAPSYPMATVGWRAVKALVRQIPGTEIREGDRIATFPGGGWVQVRSADNPDSLRGEGLDFLVIDECAFVREEAWTEALRPALSDRLGTALFISTPKGRNWFWHIWQRGRADEAEWESWQFPTTANPFIEPSEVEAARSQLPERVFEQEYLARFLEDGGGVFRRVAEAATATAQAQPVPGHQYALGVDWAKHNDFSVLALMDLTTRELVRLDRFNQIDYTLQTGRLKALCEVFRPISILAESNAMGEPLIEQLVLDGLPVTPFVTTNATKKAIIEGLALGFERDEIRILPDPVLLAELQAYEMERLPSGLLRYNAPPGMHDDTVMALALVWAVASEPPAAEVSIDPEPAVWESRRRVGMFRR